MLLSIFKYNSDIIVYTLFLHSMYKLHTHSVQGRRKGGAGGARAPPIFLKRVQSTSNIYKMSAEHSL